MSYELLLNNSIKQVLNNSSVRYIIFVLDDDVTKWYSYDFKALAEEFEEVTGYPKIDEGDFVIFENPDFNELITVSDEPLIVYEDLTSSLNYLDKRGFSSIAYADNETEYFFDDYRHLVNISSYKNISHTIEDSLIYKSYIPATNLYNIEDLDQIGEYYMIGLDSNGLVTFKSIKTVLIFGQFATSFGKLEKYSYKIDINIEPHKTYLIRVGSQNILFNFREITEDILKGPIYWDREQTIKVFENNPEIYLKEDFREVVDGILGIKVDVDLK